MRSHLRDLLAEQRDNGLGLRQSLFVSPVACIARRRSTPFGSSCTASIQATQGMPKYKVRETGRLAPDARTLGAGLGCGDGRFLPRWRPTPLTMLPPLPASSRFMGVIDPLFRLLRRTTRPLDFFVGPLTRLGSATGFAYDPIALSTQGKRQAEPPLSARTQELPAPRLLSRTRRSPADEWARQPSAISSLPTSCPRAFSGALYCHQSKRRCSRISAGASLKISIVADARANEIVFKKWSCYEKENKAS